MSDPEGSLERQGANAEHADMLCFTAEGQVQEKADLVRVFLREAMAIAESGKRAKKAVVVPDLPETLIAALDADPVLAEAFAALTPGRQKSYVLHLTSAKTERTQVARIEKARDKIFAGKGALDR